MHAANTWLLANALHLIIWFIVSFDLSTGRIAPVIPFQMLVLVIFFMVLVSLPCLVLAYFILDIMVKSKQSSSLRLIVWMIICPGLVLLEGLAAMLIFKSDHEVLNVFLPGMLAALLAAVCRYPQFKQLITVNQIN